MASMGQDTRQDEEEAICLFFSRRTDTLWLDVCQILLVLAMDHLMITCCLNCFAQGCGHIPGKTTPAEGSILAELQPIMVGKSLRQELEVAGHIVSAVSRQRAECWCPALSPLRVV